MLPIDYSEVPSWLYLLLKWVLVIAVTIALYKLSIALLKSATFFSSTEYDRGSGKYPFEKAVNFLAFWKNIFSGPFKEFLSKYDGTAPSRVYKKYREENDGVDIEIYPRQMLIMYFLVDVIFVLSLLRVYFAIDHHLFGQEGSWIYKMVEHIDVAGLINGALATILAIIIARVVENENDRQKQKLESSVKKIDIATTNIDKTGIELKENVGDILKNFTALQQKNMFEDRLNVQDRILKIAFANESNVLYSMSFSADFGYIRCRNLRVINEELERDKEDKTGKPTTEKFYRVFNRLDSKISQLQTNLIRFCRERPNDAFLAFLNHETEDRTYESPHLKYIKQVLDKNTAEVISWIQYNQPEKSEDFKTIISSAIEENRAYYIPFEIVEKKVDMRKYWQQELVAKNVEHVDQLKSTGATIELLDRMSFQFMMTVPKSPKVEKNRKNCYSIIIFSNIDAIGDNAGVYAFASSDEKIADNLINIYKAYQQQQAERNRTSKAELSKWLQFKNLFDISPQRKSFNVLKFKNLNEDIDEFLDGVAMADVQSAVHIQEMFNELDETIPEIKYSTYTKEKEGNKSEPFTDAFFQNSGTYFAIGLFGEKVEEKTSQTLAEFVIEHYCSPIITLKGRTINLSEQNSILKRITDNILQKNPSVHKAIPPNILCINGKEYKGCWTPENPKDYALIAKVSVIIRGNAVTVFIVGGINHLGTELIGKYLSTNWQELNRKSEGLPFISVYSVDDTNSIGKIEEELFYRTEAGQPDVWIEYKPDLSPEKQTA